MSTNSFDRTKSSTLHRTTSTSLSTTHQAAVQNSSGNASTQSENLDSSAIHDPVMQKQRESILSNVITWTKKNARGIYEQVS